MSALSRFLVEFEHPELPAAEIQDLGARSRAVTEKMRGEGATVRFLRTIYVPEDGRCFLLFEGGSAIEVGEAAGRVGFALSGLVEAVRLESAP
jgi:hypothetical protein